MQWLERERLTAGLLPHLLSRSCHGACRQVNSDDGGEVCERDLQHRVTFVQHNTFFGDNTLHEEAWGAFALKQFETACGVVCVCNDLTDSDAL
jgi:hypothetical protein